ncbi:hypothetical protein GCM10010216_02220 [Streptomyces flaveolus]|nr:hypothetical protein GCM10010216_02220 [Streptomyces flaveolus]
MAVTPAPEGDAPERAGFSRDGGDATVAADKTPLAYLSTGTGTPRPARRHCRRAGRDPRQRATGRKATIGGGVPLTPGKLFVAHCINMTCTQGRLFGTERVLSP